MTDPTPPDVPVEESLGDFLREHAAAVDPAEVPAIMPGMATREDLDALRELSGRDAARPRIRLASH